jgi:oligopeptide transport system permease protein
VGISCALIIATVGTFYGAIAGWFEGFTDAILMRFCDIISAIPSFILVAVVSLFMQVSLSIENPNMKAYLSLCLGISATHWMGLARIVRGLVMELKRRPFVDAAVALGGNEWHILFRHILPNVTGTIFVLVATQIPNNIMYESFMSFVGLGIQPPETSWGILVREGWKSLSTFPHLLLLPAMILFFTVLSLNVVLENIRKKLNY